MTFDDLLRSRNEALASQDLFRDPSADPRAHANAAAGARGLSLLDLSSNDYLGLASQPVSRETGGAGASRLLGGSRKPHERLERGLAAWLGLECALLFSSGYAANQGVLSCLALQGDTILSDELNHASIIDGCRLTKATTRVFPHRDLGALEGALRQATGTKWVVSESYFSMEGTTPDLGALRALCDEYGAFLVLDEAHALGVFGEEGRGLAQASGVRPDVFVGTFGKAFGAQGAFVAGSSELRAYLWNRARSFVFSTATSPALAETLLARLEMVRAATGAREHLSRLVRKLDEPLKQRGYLLPAGRHGPIFPVVLGEAAAAVRASAGLRSAGIVAPAIRPPTVPPGSSRLRITLTAAMSEGDVDRLLAALEGEGSWPR